ncbi:hypothetical protein [Legionella taurinensis]|uniref:hypothetical protein n=1 Tax=Legionella taurinensis TaxID=70611 RepID=UPI000E05AE2F|nr:hypothetical protein [Legionella taurinensis]MDX1838350.1 hypothetical protein [Legionella taurinensis]STY25383.1 Uncharacterised protein [Legionella taurinensis]
MKKTPAHSQKRLNKTKKIAEKDLQKISGGSGKWNDSWREDQRSKEENDYNNTHFKD